VRAFLWTMLVTQSVRALIGFWRLSKGEYPRKQEPETIGGDAAVLLVSGAFAVWVAILLWR